MKETIIEIKNLKYAYTGDKPALRGIDVTIGKGERSREAYETICTHGGVYLTAVGGTGALLSGCIEQWETVAFEELGDQAIRRYLLKDFPVTVAADSEGRNLFDIGKFKYRRF